MSERNLADEIEQANARVERLFWLPGLNSDAPPDFVDFVEYDLADSQRVIDALPFLREFVNDADADDILGELIFRGITGFIFQAATPRAFNFSKDGRSYSSSWGNYYTCWMYAKTEADICNQIVTWAAEKLAADRCPGNRKKKIIADTGGAP